MKFVKIYQASHENVLELMPSYSVIENQCMSSQPHININRSSIDWAREQQQASIALSFKQKFHTDSPLVDHWDSKILANLTGEMRSIIYQ